MRSPTRPLGLYLGLLGSTIGLGLPTRGSPAAFPDLLAALAVALAVELGQLYPVPWASAVRATRGGTLVLGHGYPSSDLLYCLIGVMCVASLDTWIMRRRRAGSTA